MSDYTPDTEEVRGDYANFQLPSIGGDFRVEYAEGLAEFDRWLARYRESVIDEVEDHLVRRDQFTVGYASDVIDEMRGKK